ncbi:thioredoxin domain-containing protein [Mucilaginibacter sp. dw_454]|uniref:thioredoxin domain-containing protein n=1 Tax=Mucilaginibacter sp. dw_454 TaxID=2720079 RepID=UPI001BD506AA|nr:thioredoxin domain-containing protein [Mucilaginibacter sp. dw_454]
MNRLANSSSPYLLQHANNPVDWYPWGPEALQRARDENKLIIVSIGYSACHWCHVMEHESFEDEQVAAVMNEYFVCIKVDREERPDVDQIYMSAVQLISGRGGWPLNCICLPDQRPIYAGTYFKKNDWTSLLFNLADYYKQKPEDALEYAARLTEGIQKYESIPFVTTQPEYNKEDLATIVNNWKKYFDCTEGGFGTAPKFPMPNNWQFLIRYAHLMQDEEIAELAKLTLQKLAEGGIYDHLGGGFARYSVDGLWHVPHFEKMLYDNGQLISLYSEAYTWQPNELYKQIVTETVDFATRELFSPEDGFYSALDADSEGVEGKFYTFNKEEIQQVLGAEAELFCVYYHITDEGNWEEEETNILFKRGHDNDLAEAIGISVEEMLESVAASRKKLFDVRAKRIRPGLDNKILASWNGLMLKGLCDAYRAFNNAHYLELALKNAGFIVDHLLNHGRIIRVYKGPANAEQGGKEAFLDDYANVIDAFIVLYEVTFDEQWLTYAVQLADNAIDHYFDNVSGIFFFTADDDEQLIARKSEIMDGVIPSSNSVMARNLHKLGLLFDNEQHTEIAEQLLRNIMPHMAKYGSAYSNWGMLLLEEVFGTSEVAIVGENSEALRIEMEKNYVPNKIILGGKKGSLPLLRDKFTGRTQIFVCKDKTCGLPVDTIADALKQIKA